MINFLKNSISIFILFLVLPKLGLSQCTIPSINAQAGTGPSTVVCAGQCANLTATMVSPPNSTTTYSVGSVTYSTMPYFGGNNVFSTSSDDLWSDSISIGFNFCYFGNTYSKLLVGSNGEITFDLTKANGFESWVTTAILPNTIEHPGNTICGAYRDYDPFPGGVVRTYTTGVAPCRQFVAYWSGVTLFSCATPVSSFQIVLYEGSNKIAVNIVNSTACVGWNGGRGLIGIQNAAGTTAVAPPTRNTLVAWTAINESWVFTPTAAPSFSVNWAGPGGFTATGLTATPCPTASGTYSATLSYCNASKTSTVQVNVNTPTITATASSNTVCAPASVTLTGSGATTYTWLPGGLTGATIAVSPTVNTTYTLLGTAGTCTNSTTISLTVGTPPTISAFNLSGTICAGGSANAVASGALSYTWNPGGITGNLVSLSPTVTTTYTVLGSSGGCVGQTTVVIPVGSSPTITAVSSPTSICAGGSATITASGATSYTWNPGALTGATVVVSPTVTTTYSITGTNTLTCPGTKTVTLVVNVTPTLTAVSNPTAICVGSTATLTSSGATTYTWMPGALAGATVTVSPAITTIYTVTGSNGTCSSTETVQTTVNAVPVVTASASSSTVCAGTSLTLTAGGATTYTWNPGALAGATVAVTPAISTIYTVTGSNGTCSNTSAVSVTVNASPTVSATSSPTAICVGSTATLTASGALTYTWMPGAIAGTTLAVTPLVTTTYSVTGTNAAGCTNTKTISVFVNTIPTVTATASPTSICSGSSSTLTASGATTYTWNPGAIASATAVVSPTITTNYTVTGANGACTSTATLSLLVNPNPTVTAVASPTSICSGASSTLTSSGATTYTWMPGALAGGTVVVAPTITTTYTVTGTNGACTNTKTITLIVNPNPTLTAAASPTSICSGASSTLTSSGAASYTWNPGALAGGTVVVTPTITTNYTVTGANGACISTKTVSLIVNTTPTLTASSSPTVICSGSSATLTGTGATTYTWNPGALAGSTVVVSPTVTTTYTLLGATGTCTNSITVSLSVTPTPTVTAVSSPTGICSGASATLTGNGATSYTWNPGALSGTSVVVSPTITTTYTVIGATGVCSNSNTVSLTVSNSPTLVVGGPPVICSGRPATLTVSGAITYTWNPGALTGTSIVVSPTVTTTYSVTGDNGLGCTSTSTLLLVVNPSPTVTAVASPTSICSGSSSTITASGAITYTWLPGGATTSSIIVNPGTTTTYSVRGMNAFGCPKTFTVLLVVNPNPTLTASSSPTAICSGASATLTSSGATTYTWNPGALAGGTVVVTPTINTTYTVTGDNGGCTGTQTVSLVVNANPTVTASSSPTAICSGATATLTGSGATTYTWNPGALTGTSVAVTPTITTTYTVLGNNGTCSNTNTVLLTVNANPTVTATASPTSICVAGSVTLTASGATTYTWNPGPIAGATVVVSPTVTTIYTLDGSNAAGCIGSTTLAVVVNTVPVVSAISSSTAICTGATATLTGVGAASYTWNPGAIAGTTVVVSPTVTTVYTVTGANGSCSSTNTISITVNPNPTVTATGTPTSICSGATVTLTAAGALTYTWIPGGLMGSTVTVTPGSTTTYTVRGANATGCRSTFTVLINVTPTPTVIATSSPTSICIGSSATLTASGATTYTWNPGAIAGATTVVSPTVTTNYTVTGDNGGGCISTQTVSLIVNTNPTITASSSPTVICSGSTATLTGTGALTYTWNPGALTGATVAVTPTINTTYTLTGANGACTTTQTVSIAVNASPTVTAVSSPTAICSGASATLTGSGATSYTWMPGALTTTAITVSPTVTTVYTLTGSNGTCSNTKTVSLTVTTTPTITASSNPTVLCVGSSATLTGSGATTYTWMPGALTGISVVVSPTVATTYSVIGASGTCLSNSVTLLLNVNSNPTVTASSSPTIMCSGSTATLTGTGAVTYTWMPGALSGATVTVTPATTTTYTLTGSNASGCKNTTTVALTINPTPTLTASSSPTAICLAGSVTLTASGASSYTWNPGGALTGTTVVTPTVTTTYTVTGSSVAGCTSTKTLAVVVNTVPIVTASASPTIICSGSTASLTGSGATTYTWMPGALSGSMVTVTPTVNTTYTVTGANGACTNTQTVSLSVNPIPTVTAISNPTAICSGSSATLTGNGAVTYTWSPGALNGTTVVVTPTVTTNYTVIGTDALGCTNSTTVTLNVNTPTITATGSPTAICIVGSSTLSAVGAATYTWNPGAATGSSVVVTPTTTTTYTVNGTNAFGCTSSSTITIVINTMPTVTAVSSSTIICSGTTATLTGGGATTYTWNPGAITNSVAVVSPTTNTNYTLTGANGACVNTTTIGIFVIPSPANVTATNSGPINCTLTAVNLFGSTTNTNVTYGWTGPASFTSAVQNPTAVTTSGTYTLVVTDALTGCSTATTTTIISNTVAPSVTVTPTGSITCVTFTVGLNTSASSPSVTFSWTGPASFTSIVQNPTVNVSGTYTLTTTNFTNGCVTTTTVTVITNTYVAIGATITPATCTGTVTNNNGTIKLGGFTVLDKYDYVAGATYTGAATYATATNIPVSGVITNTLSNPLVNTPYTVRIFEAANGCFKDTTLILIPIDCGTFNSLGIAKAVSTPTLNGNGSYDVIYKVVARNTGALALNNIVLNEKLSNTFPLPTTFSVTSMPVITTAAGTSLTLNGTFDGSVQTSITNTLTSILPSGRTDTIMFKVNIKPNGLFGPFNNRVIGVGTASTAAVVSDTSNIGINPDPDLDGNPTNNNLPTPLNLAPNLFFGLTKEGSVSAKLTDDSYDFTYTVTVHNLGNDTLRNVVVKDSLFGTTIKSPAIYSIKNLPVAGGSLTANSSYDGHLNPNLLIPATSKIAPGAINTIIFTINVKPDTFRVFSNIAIGRAIGTGSVVLKDTSNTGNNPDVNGNGIPNEPSDNMPTILRLPDEFFIPQALTPNGDGKNDFFYIKGITGTENTLTIFNRWGNKVYKKDNYDNSWQGQPNVGGTLGTDKLPPGTYYYILEFRGSTELKSTNGFVVLQY